MSDIIDFTKLVKNKNPIPANGEFDISALVKKALTEFTEALPEPVSYFAIAFDKNGDPILDYGGQVDFLKLIGTLELIKLELGDYVRNNFEEDLEY